MLRLQIKPETLKRRTQELSALHSAGRRSSMRDQRGSGAYGTYILFELNLHSCIICTIIAYGCTHLHTLAYPCILKLSFYTSLPLSSLSPSLHSLLDHFPPRSSSVPPLSIHTTTNHDRPLSSDSMMVVHFIDNGRYSCGGS